MFEELLKVPMLKMNKSDANLERSKCAGRTTSEHDPLETCRSRLCLQSLCIADFLFIYFHSPMTAASFGCVITDTAQVVGLSFTGWVRSFRLVWIMGRF